jgi:hypothetical protein
MDDESPVSSNESSSSFDSSDSANDSSEEEEEAEDKKENSHPVNIKDDMNGVPDKSIKPATLVDTMTSDQVDEQQISESEPESEATPLEQKAGRLTDL